MYVTEHHSKQRKGCHLVMCSPSFIGSYFTLRGVFSVLLARSAARMAGTSTSLAVSAAGGPSCLFIFAELYNDRNYDRHKNYAYQDRSPV